MDKMASLTPAIIRIEATKIGLGSTPPQRQFKHIVKDAKTGSIIATGTNTADGSIIFTDILLSIEDEYHFIVKETAAPTGWTLDSTEFLVNVHVSLAADNASYSAIIGYPEEIPVFASSFYLQGGLIEFPCIQITEPGVYTYRIKELTTSLNGWIADTTEFPVVVTVTDDGYGNLNPTISYPEGFPQFHNQYRPTPAHVVLQGSVTAKAEPLPASVFEFAVQNADEELIASAANDANGSIIFPPILLQEEGLYTYTIKQLSPSKNGWITDTAVYPASVAVSDNGMGSLVMSIDYPDGEPHFINSYEASPTCVSLSAAKITMGTPNDGPFLFGLYDEAGNEIAIVNSEELENKF